MQLAANLVGRQIAPVRYMPTLCVYISRPLKQFAALLSKGAQIDRPAGNQLISGEESQI